MYDPAREVERVHGCKPPSDHFNPHVGRYRAYKAEGTLWKCGKCGAYWVVRRNFTLKHWYPVEKNDIALQKQISEIETRLAERTSVGFGVDKFFRDIGRALTFKKG